jgi:hypothetical protein
MATSFPGLQVIETFALQLTKNNVIVGTQKSAIVKITAPDFLRT